MASRGFGTVFFLTVFSFVLSSLAAPYLAVQTPISQIVHNNDTVYLGKVGPGESFYILASPATTNQSGTLINIGWSKLTTTRLPIGWSAQPSPLFENPMKMKISVASSAMNGTYLLTVRAVNVYSNYSNPPNLTFNAYINVTPNVFSSSVTPIKINTGLGQPVNLQIVINNTGASDDPFIIASHGLPAWNISAEVVSLHKTTTTYFYPVFVSVPGVYNFNLNINSTSSPLIHKTYPITLIAKASLLNDYSATGQGVILSPIIYEPVYAFLLLLNNVYHSIFG